MSYIGKGPGEHFTSFQTETFSVSATTSYTLSHSVANENELALFINNVRQQPGSGKAYTASGTALTLSAATATTDTMYAIYLGRALQTSVPHTNSITSDMLASTFISGETALTSEPASTDELLLSDAGTLKRIDYSLITNTPAFSAYLNADQTSLADNTWIKVAANTEFYDSDGKYDVSTYRFTPTVAGKYMFGASIYIEGSATMNSSSIALYKNGSKIFYKEENADDITNQQITGALDLDVDDYVELYIKVDVASSGTFFVNQDGTTTNNRAYWYGYKLTGA